MAKKKHFMIDIETLGTGLDSIIACIAVVPFNPETGHVGKGVEWRLSVDDGAKLGFKMDCDTVAWWEKQSDAAREQLDGELLVRSAILSVMDWFGKRGDKDLICVWGNGAKFDLGLLTMHFERLDYGHELPWNYDNELDVRTLVRLGRAVGYDPKNTMDFEGVRHSALDDAKHQAKYVSLLWQKLGLIEDAEAA